MQASRSQQTFSFLENLSIQVKAFAASAVLLVCLALLGAVAYIALDRSQAGLRTLSTTTLPTQQAFVVVKDEIAAVQMKVFRYVSWASNSVSESNLKALSRQIDDDIRIIGRDIDALATRPGLDEAQKSSLKSLGSIWKDYERAVKDTLEVGSTDAAMATMMLGQSDDKYVLLASDFQRLSNSVVTSTNESSVALYTDAEQKKLILAIGAAIGLLLSIVISVLVSRSIVKPIRLVTDAMRQLSSGNTNVAVGFDGRRDEIGQMVESIKVFRQNAVEMRVMELENLEMEKRNIRETAAARARLTDAIESISEGFSLFDADDKLVVYNSKYKNLHSTASELVEPGTSFETIIRAAYERSEHKDQLGDFDQWLAHRLERHRNPGSPHMQRRNDGRFIQISERKTTDGGVVATYADITELKQREAELALSSEQLAAAHAQVTGLNAQLQSENLRMGSELEVTRRLQLMLLPGIAELQGVKGLDIAGHMQPAVEVGGDYYDVLQHEGRVKIGIGDVTGHGLESGVVMVMTQAIVRALLTSGETDHVRFLNTLNQALFGNVQRMGADKNLTLCLLDYAAGVVKVSGQHEEMIVVRRNGTVELVNTVNLGFPVGLVDEISEFIGQATITLGPGDGIVLYTDGITEAENMLNQQYGLERLCGLVSRHWSGTAEDIKEAVVSDVAQYIGKQTVYDDITLVVLKQQ